MGRVEIKGEALCKCGATFRFDETNLPSARTCSCGIKSTIQQCVCGDIILIYESAMHKHVTCGNCGRTIQGKLSDEKSTQETVGGATETEYGNADFAPVYRQPIVLDESSDRTFDPNYYSHPHREVIANSVSGPVYSGDKTSTCWGGNKKNGRRQR